MKAAMMAYEQGQTEKALEMLNHALAKDPDNADLKVTIAQIVHAEGDTVSATALLDSLDSEGSKLDAAIKLRTKIKLAEQLADLPDIEDIDKRLAQNPLDLEALLYKSRHLAADDEYDDAMTCLLTIVRTDRGFEEDIGRVSLLELFDLLGGEHPSVQSYRRKLFTLLH
jgi:putative thioredoxin